ncbi:diacylglycerol kinase [Pseudidiomarina tainanensis]|jgi:diacylglycerol kinase (ATP)|uniref:Diacylglycerol kinase n=2 Tax=Pseudidiomarina TaxID=2800384 RepID=A0A1I6G5S5_9GAMM|nr:MULTISPECIES: diacylglycerol kinase [Pseudidiomarina]RZQ57120.1 diacylglycerol kinase [Pseudidiomarina tainanensis]SFR37491.1 diacylglycerol kinase [Pseudidiomarina maritima]
MKANKTGLDRIIHATFNSMRGIAKVWKYEAAFRQEAILCAILIPVALLIEASLVERLLLIFTLFIVVITELLNSAVEAVVDRIGAEFHELSGRAKDIASAAVFFALVLMIVVWCAILFTPQFLQ